MNIAKPIMKTAENWLVEELFDNERFLNVIKQIQLDAWRQGMTDAAELVDGIVEYEKLIKLRDSEPPEDLLPTD